MKATKSNKRYKLVKRSIIISANDVVGKGVRVENGRGKVHFRPTTEMIGMKYGELVKTRTPARKRIVGGKPHSNKQGGKKS